MNLARKVPVSLWSSLDNCNSYYANGEINGDKRAVTSVRVSLIT